jgi:hypothetical protein
MMQAAVVISILLAASAHGQTAQGSGVVANVPEPGPEQEALGRRLAAAGDFQAVVSTIGRGEVDRLAAAQADLTEAERARFREVGYRELNRGREELIEIVGELYARQFGANELRSIVDFFESPVGRRYTGALGGLIPQIAAAIEDRDLGADVRAAFCRETGRLCETAPR